MKLHYFSWLRTMTLVAILALAVVSFFYPVAFLLSTFILVGSMLYERQMTKEEE